MSYEPLEHPDPDIPRLRVHTTSDPILARGVIEVPYRAPPRAQRWFGYAWRIPLGGCFGLCVWSLASAGLSVWRPWDHVLAMMLWVMILGGACAWLTLGLIVSRQRRRAVELARATWSRRPAPRDVGEFCSLVLSYSGYRRGWMRNVWPHLDRMDRAIDEEFSREERQRLPGVWIIDGAAIGGLRSFLSGGGKAITLPAHLGKYPVDFGSAGKLAFLCFVTGVLFSPWWHSRVPWTPGLLSTTGVLAVPLALSLLLAGLHQYFGVQLQRFGGALWLAKRRGRGGSIILRSFSAAQSTFVLLPEYAGGPLNPHPDEREATLYLRFAPDLSVSVQFNEKSVKSIAE
ncbi:MAG: hypothetical protein ACKVZJ_13455 [Phycisphaerales bacterium]